MGKSTNRQSSMGSQSAAPAGTSQSNSSKAQNRPLGKEMGGKQGGGSDKR